MSTQESKYRQEEWLREQYVAQDKTQKEMAARTSVTQATIGKYLRKYNFDTGNKGRKPVRDERLGDEEWLREKYEGEMWSMADIAEECDCSGNAVKNRFLKFEIETRSKQEMMTERSCERISESKSNRTLSEETRRKMSESHMRSEDGTPLDFRATQEWYRLREDVIERDNSECQLCGIDREKNKQECDSDFHVHHITPVSVGGEKFDPLNLITLCRECHWDAHRALNY